MRASFCLYSFASSPSSGAGEAFAVTSVDGGVISSYFSASLRSFLRLFLSCFSEEVSSSACLLILALVNREVEDRRLYTIQTALDFDRIQNFVQRAEDQP